jgi:purine-binding chemotaxis protein CheW
MADTGNKTDDTGMLVATFVIENANFGIDANIVQEVVQVKKSTPVHHAPLYISGVMNLRGKVVTIIDLGEKLDLGEIVRNNLNRILIVEWKQEYIGLLIDNISEVIQIDKKDILEAPSNVHGVQSTYIAGVFQNTVGQLVGLLNVDKILDIDDQILNEVAKTEQK